MKKNIIFKTKMVLAITFILCVFSTETSAQIQEGKLYREISHPEVFVIHDGKESHIPTPDALLAMGYQWSDVIRTRRVIIERDGRGKPHRTIDFIDSSPPLEIRMPGSKTVTKQLF